MTGGCLLGKSACRITAMEKPSGGEAIARLPPQAFFVFPRRLRGMADVA
jgi:hypothetical protein